LFLNVVKFARKYDNSKIPGYSLKIKGDKVAGVGEVWYNNLRLKIRRERILPCKSTACGAPHV